MNTKLMLTAVCAFGIPSVATSAGDFYTGVGGGAHRLESGDFEDWAPTFRLFGGYDFNQFVAAEAAYLRLFETKDNLGGNPVEIDGNVWELSTKLSYPFMQQFQGYARLGWSYYEITGKSAGFAGPFTDREYGDDFSWAIGGNYDFTRGFGLRGEYGQIDVDDGDAEFLSLNLTYKFGGK